MALTIDSPASLSLFALIGLGVLPSAALHRDGDGYLEVTGPSLSRQQDEQEASDIVIASGRFIELKSAAVDLSMPDTNSKPSVANSQSPPATVGVFAPTTLFRGRVGSKTILVDLTVQDTDSASFLWACSECTLVLARLPNPASSKDPALPRLVSQLRAKHESTTELFSVANRGNLGLVVLPGEEEPVIGVSRDVLVLTRLSKVLPGTAPYEPRPHGGGPWSFVPESPFIERMVRAEKRMLLGSPPPGGKRKTFDQMVVMHPETRLPSLICFDHTELGFGTSRAHPRGPFLAFWLDGRMIRLVGEQADGAPIYEGCTFELSALSNMIEWMRSARNDESMALVGSESGPDSPSDSLSIYGFGESVSIVAHPFVLGKSDSGSNPLSRAYHRVLEQLKAVQVTEPKSLGTIKLEKRAIAIPIRS